MKPLSLSDTETLHMLRQMLHSSIKTNDWGSLCALLSQILISSPDLHVPLLKKFQVFELVAIVALGELIHSFPGEERLKIAQTLAVAVFVRASGEEDTCTRESALSINDSTNRASKRRVVSKPLTSN